MGGLTTGKCPHGCGWEWEGHDEDEEVMLLAHWHVCPARIAEVDRRNAAELANYRARPVEKGAGHWRGKYS